MGNLIWHHGKLTCDMTKACQEPVTHIDYKGYIYCAKHGQERKSTCRCRKLTKKELTLLQTGEPLAIHIEMLNVQSAQCRTCIYRPDSTLDPIELEAQIADPRMAGHFKGYRICHHAKDVCCRGFWNKHKNHFDLGQIAQRLKMVKFVKVDVLT